MEFCILLSESSATNDEYQIKTITKTPSVLITVSPHKQFLFPAHERDSLSISESPIINY